jgi:hypothetical protein
MVSLRVRPERPAERPMNSRRPRPDPLQFVAPDAPIVDRRAHQHGRRAQLLHPQHVIDPANTAAHADGDRRMVLPEPDQQVSRPDPLTRPHPREIQQDEGTDAAGDGPIGNLAWLLTGPRRASCKPWLPIIQVQAEDRSTGSDTPDQLRQLVRAGDALQPEDHPRPVGIEIEHRRESSQIPDARIQPEGHPCCNDPFVNFAIGKLPRDGVEIGQVEVIGTQAIA